MHCFGSCNCDVLFQMTVHCSDYSWINCPIILVIFRLYFGSRVPGYTTGHTTVLTEDDSLLLFVLPIRHKGKKLERLEPRECKLLVPHMMIRMHRCVITYRDSREHLRYAPLSSSHCPRCSQLRSHKTNSSSVSNICFGSVFCIASVSVCGIYDDACLYYTRCAFVT